MELGFNVFNIDERDTSTCICTDTIRNVFDLIKKLLGIENERAQREMFEQKKKNYLWHSTIIRNADFYLRPCLFLDPCTKWIYTGLPNTAVEYRRQGIPLSTLLVNLLSVLYYKFSDEFCCCLAIDGTTYFSSDDFEVIGALGALRGKTEFMEVLVNYDYLRTLPDSSPLLKQETEEIMLSFMESVSISADIHLPQLFEDVMDLLRNTFFRGKATEAIYKRVFFAACALRAVQYSLQNEHGYVENLIKCLRLYFNVTCDIYISRFEVKCVLYSCFILLNKLDLFDQYAEKFDSLMPECPDRPEPQKLTHLVRRQVRKNLKFSKLTLPSAVDRLVLPKMLKNFVRGEDLPGKNRNTSLKKAIMKSELAGLLFERPRF